MVSDDNCIICGENNGPFELRDSGNAPCQGTRFRAYSMMLSLSLRKSSCVSDTKWSGAIPCSVHCLLTSYMGHAEKRTPHPLGNSLEKGSPAPPPVWSPMMVTCGKHFMYFTNSLAALNTLRLVRRRTCFCHRTPLLGLMCCSLSEEKFLVGKSRSQFFCICKQTSCIITYV